MESERVDLNLDDLEKVSGGKEYELNQVQRLPLRWDMARIKR